MGTGEADLMDSHFYHNHNFSSSSTSSSSFLSSSSSSSSSSRVCNFNIHTDLHKQKHGFEGTE
uniref:Uncharacterized protein n=1 Tax=Cucumis melo TaxID=3656 RepID=A0A9I9DKF8_CUCME